MTTVQPAGAASAEGHASAAAVRAATAANHARAPAARAGQPPGAARPVVLVGIPGLRWSDVLAAGTPALWRLASAGSVGSLVVHATSPVTCPADGWLTLNAGARAGAPRPRPGRCPALPAVVPDRPASGSTPAPARIPQMPALTAYTRQARAGAPRP